MSLSENRPKLHSYFTWKSDVVVGKVLNSLFAQLVFKSSRLLHLSDESGVFVDAEISSQLNLTIIKDVFDSDLTLVVVNEVLEGNCRLKPNERVGEVEDDA